MRVVAWDTSTKSTALVALEWQEGARDGWASVQVVAELVLSNELTQSERLVWGIHSLCESARWTLDSLGGLGVGVGPGSFTGLRIGVTTARTLGQALAIPVVGVSSLAATARPLAVSLGAYRKERTLLVTAVEACKGELYLLVGSARSVMDCITLASGDSPGQWKRGVEEAVCTYDEGRALVKRKLNEGPRGQRKDWVMLGNRKMKADPSFWKILSATKPLEIVDAEGPIPRALGQLVWEGWQAGQTRDALSVVPRYLRASDAEKKLRARLATAKNG